ncbi:NAD-dependent epimerase/dehydratase family protein [Sulfitobacter sp. MF3-043]|uniref:NAD-dependent epimerase/dehydratase family protein n=1 Tax=Sulfitobacter sediminivivens TaxID=3252902 RepID=UPI0036D862E4
MKFSGSEKLRGQRVLVTGGTGFVGARLVPALLENGAHVTALLRSHHSARMLRQMGANVVIGALDDPSVTGAALREQDVLFHLAYDMRAPAATNLAGFNALMAAAEAADIKRIIHVSSIVVYDGWPQADLAKGSPVSRPGGTPYRQAKMTMEQTLMSGPCRAAILQPTLIYGPGSMLWTDRLADWLAAGTVVLPDPEGLCNVVFVDDLVQAMLRAAVLTDLGRERFIISGASPAAWSDLLNGYAQIIGAGAIRHEGRNALENRLPPDTPHRIPDTPPLAARISATARQLLGRDRFETLVRSIKRRMTSRGDTYPDRYMLELFSTKGICRIDHARTRLGYEPKHDLARGLAATEAYLKARYGK